MTRTDLTLVSWYYARNWIHCHWRYASILQFVFEGHSAQSVSHLVAPESCLASACTSLVKLRGQWRIDTLGFGNDTEAYVTVVAPTKDVKFCTACNHVLMTHSCKFRYFRRLKLGRCHIFFHIWINAHIPLWIFICHFVLSCIADIDQLFFGHGTAPKKLLPKLSFS